MLVKRLICSKFVIGMMPGMIGTSMPLARARSTNVEVVLVVEEELRDQELGARRDLVVAGAQVRLGVDRLRMHLGVAGAADAEVV